MTDCPLKAEETLARTSQGSLALGESGVWQVHLPAVLRELDGCQSSFKSSSPPRFLLGRRPMPCFLGPDHPSLLSTDSHCPQLQGS